MANLRSLHQNRKSFIKSFLNAAGHPQVNLESLSDKKKKEVWLGYFSRAQFWRHPGMDCYTCLDEIEKHQQLSIAISGEMGRENAYSGKTK